MKEYMIENVKILAEEEIVEEEIQYYLDYVKKNHKGQILESLELKLEGNEVLAISSFKPMQFEKIRRITGYLVGTVERFNDGKKAEEKDRVKHV